MPEPTQSCKKGYFSPPRKMDFNCTYNLVGDRTAFIWENHVICVIHLTESAPSTTLHLSNNSSSAFFFFLIFYFQFHSTLFSHPSFSLSYPPFQTVPITEVRKPSPPLKLKKQCSSWINKEVLSNTMTYFFLDHNLHPSASKFQLVCSETLLQSVMCAVCPGYPENKKDSSDEEEREKSILY